MRKVTVSVSNEIYREIRAWCAQRDICVSHVVQAFLNDLSRLEKIRDFRLPDALDPHSLGELFNRFEPSELDQIPLSLAGFL
jgi:hypothetical protein